MPTFAITPDEVATLLMLNARLADMIWHDKIADEILPEMTFLQARLETLIEDLDKRKAHTTTA